MASASTSQRLRISEAPTLSPAAEDAERLVELCGGDRLDAWRIALGKSKTEPVLAAYWINVADAVARFRTIPTPSGVASLLVAIVGLLTDSDSKEPLKAIHVASDPRVQAWAKAAMNWLDKELTGVRG